MQVDMRVVLVGPMNSSLAIFHQSINTTLLLLQACRIHHSMQLKCRRGCIRINSTGNKDIDSRRPRLHNTPGHNRRRHYHQRAAMDDHQRIRLSNRRS